MMIRDAVATDLKFISEIEVSCWGADGATLGDFQEFFLEKSKFQYLQVIEVNEELAGFIGYSYDVENGCIDIWNLAISTKYRRSGCGTRLVNHARSIGTSLNAKYIALKVSEKNTRAIGLYQKLGFQKTSTTINYYSDKSACLKFFLSI